MINIPSDILATPVFDKENSNKTLRDLVEETVENEVILEYTYSVHSDVIKTFTVKTKDNNYKLVAGPYCDILIKL